MGIQSLDKKIRQSRTALFVNLWSGLLAATAFAFTHDISPYKFIY